MKTLITTGFTSICILLLCALVPAQSAVPDDARKRGEDSPSDAAFVVAAPGRVCAIVVDKGDPRILTIATRLRDRIKGLTGVVVSLVPDGKSPVDQIVIEEDNRAAGPIPRYSIKITEIYRGAGLAETRRLTIMLGRLAYADEALNRLLKELEVSAASAGSLKSVSLPAGFQDIVMYEAVPGIPPVGKVFSASEFVPSAPAN